MSPDTERCLNCNRTSDQVPLLRLKYVGQDNWICPQCLPILIHHPERLVAMSGEWVNFPSEDKGR